MPLWLCKPCRWHECVAVLKLDYSITSKELFSSSEREQLPMTKIWFITGASRGFGREWAEAALERGDKVAATARKIETLNELVQRFGDAVLPLQLDVTDRARAFSAVQQTAAHFGA